MKAGLITHTVERCTQTRGHRSAQFWALWHSRLDQNVESFRVLLATAALHLPHSVHQSPTSSRSTDRAKVTRHGSKRALYGRRRCWTFRLGLVQPRIQRRIQSDPIAPKSAKKSPKTLVNIRHTIISSRLQYQLASLPFALASSLACTTPKVMQELDRYKDIWKTANACRIWLSQPEALANGLLVKRERREIGSKVDLYHSQASYEG